MGNRLIGNRIALAIASALSASVAHAQLLLPTAASPVPSQSVSQSQTQSQSQFLSAVDLQSEAPADAPSSSLSRRLSDPYRLAIVDQPDSVYPEIAPAQPEAGINAGAVKFSLDITYWTRYVFRGVDQGTIGSKPENSLQFSGAAEFDLGKLPHPFVGLFVNVFNTDPISRFEEVRPFAGLAWDLKPLMITAAYTSYIFPNRKDNDTEEGSLRVDLDDSRVWRTEKPVVTPYILAAYDFDLYDGFYLEAGIHHDFVIQYTGLTITPLASVAYVIHDKYFQLPDRVKDTGFQHFQVGITLDYSLNLLLNIPQRYGNFHVVGNILYDDGIDQHLRADNRVFGGGGVRFEY